MIKNAGFEAYMKLSIHGCRGSIATSSPSTRKYGGNTSCYEITTENHQIIFDAGSGFQKVNFSSDRTSYLLLSHFHHDHIQGLPFNSQLFDPKNEVVISSDLNDWEVAKKNVKMYFSPPYFPIDIVSSLPNVKFLPFKQVQEKLLECCNLDSIALNHPGGSMGYKLSQKGSSFIYLCDNEFEETQREKLLAFAKNADVLVWDGMFTEKELIEKKGWGHSSIEQAVEFNKKAKCKKVLISHHAPDRNDQELDQIAKGLPETFTLSRDELEVEL